MSANAQSIHTKNDYNTSNKRKHCSIIKNDGKPCKCYSMSDSDTCSLHSYKKTKSISNSNTIVDEISELKMYIGELVEDNKSIYLDYQMTLNSYDNQLDTVYYKLELERTKNTNLTRSLRYSFMIIICIIGYVFHQYTKENEQFMNYSTAITGYYDVLISCPWYSSLISTINSLQLMCTHCWYSLIKRLKYNTMEYQQVYANHTL